MVQNDPGRSWKLEVCFSFIVLFFFFFFFFFFGVGLLLRYFTHLFLGCI